MKRSASVRDMKGKVIDKIKASKKRTNVLGLNYMYRSAVLFFLEWTHFWMPICSNWDWISQGGNAENCVGLQVDQDYETPCRAQLGPSSAAEEERGQELSCFWQKAIEAMNFDFQELAQSHGSFFEWRLQSL